ncbi:hypothetical protein NPIL_96511 [Nephila pilipes]|uniref:Uncharacterized protein n=1 Tax=Nephila pilipes TaxID=299642 RepID=A0A8X6PXK8_NEPPI|nr:hypothetical protein NPIL_96511 [Nephila pilipes]
MKSFFLCVIFLTLMTAYQTATPALAVYCYRDIKGQFQCIPLHRQEVVKRPYINQRPSTDNQNGAKMPGINQRPYINQRPSTDNQNGAKRPGIIQVNHRSS